MRDLLDAGLTRAGVFFAAAFLVATVGGIALGDVRMGLTTGISAGFVAAAFGYLFVRPADPDGR